MEHMARYQVRLQGKQARLGDVAAVDIARLILGVQTVVARAAGAAVGRRPKSTGRWESTLEDATKLRLVKVGRGSVVVELQPPHPGPIDNQLGLDTQSLGDIGWNTAVAAVNDSPNADPDVATRLLGLAESLAIGSRFDAIEFRTDGHPVARIDAETRQRLHGILRTRREQVTASPAVSGVLFEADFERRTAKVRSQSGEVVELIFEGEQADAIQEALRERSEFEGDVTFDPVTNSIRSVRLRRLTRFEQLLLGEDGARSFWEPISFEELSSHQATTVISSFDDLHDDSLSEDEYERFVSTLS
jgi:hypothetical protein